MLYRENNKKIVEIDWSTLKKEKKAENALDIERGNI